MSERYIGDGVYASFDGYHIWLKTERLDGSDKIALEPEVFAELLRFHADIVKLREALGDAISALPAPPSSETDGMKPEEKKA